MHTAIGNSCVGVRINGLKLPFRTLLKNGDEIEIIRGDNMLPSENWLHHVKTGKARAAIRHALREREEADYIKLGGQMIDNLFAAEGLEADVSVLERALGIMHYETLDLLKLDVGRGDISAADVLLAVMPPKIKRKRDTFRDGMRSLMRMPAEDAVRRKTILPLSSGLRGTAVNIAEGCFPLPGDEIVGEVSSGKGVVVYPSAAPQLLDIPQERQVAMRWDADADDNCSPAVCN